MEGKVFFSKSKKTYAEMYFNNSELTTAADPPLIILEPQEKNPTCVCHPDTSCFLGYSL